MLEETSEEVNLLLHVQCNYNNNISLTPSSYFMAVTLFFLQTKHVHISQELSIYLSLCLLGTTLVGESCTPWIPWAANCKLKFVLGRHSWDVFYFMSGSYESSSPWQQHKRCELPPCLMNTETLTQLQRQQYGWVMQNRFLQNGFWNYEVFL